MKSLSCVQLFAIPWAAAPQASLSVTISQSLLKIMSIESVMPSNYRILCCPLLLLPSIFPRISVFFNELTLQIRWPKYWSLGEGNSTPLQYSCLENPMDGGAWWATVHSVTKSRTRLSDFTFTLLLGRKVMTNLNSILKSRDITFPTNVRLVKAMVYPVVMYTCESWTVKKAEHRGTDAFELWCWR